MLLGFLFIIGGLCTFMTLERIFPDRDLPYVPGWWIRVLIINIAQLAIVVLGAYTWERWLQVPSIFHLGDYLSPMWGGLLAYHINTWIFYWFHRARHEIYLFWILFHQVHHSPQRIETATSFYKHPLEILMDSFLMTVLLFPILGLPKEASIWLSIPSAYGEYFYHMNIKTPRWVGYLMQRPESHRIHHLRNKIENCKNYSDCPMWDILGDTYDNPVNDTVPTGFETKNEVKLLDMLMFKDVLQTEKGKKRSLGINLTNLMSLLLLALGLSQPIGYLFNNPTLRGLGVVSVASPNPLVFTAYNGVETYSTSFYIDIYTTRNSGYSLDVFNIEITKELYALIEGPYNFRNVIGILFSHGAFFKNPKLIALRDHIQRNVICGDKLQLKKHLPGLSEEDHIDHAEIHIYSNTQHKTWTMFVYCSDSPFDHTLQELQPVYNSL